MIIYCRVDLIFLLLQRWSCRCWSSRLNLLHQRRIYFGNWASLWHQWLWVRVRDPNSLWWWSWCIVKDLMSNWGELGCSTLVSSIWPYMFTTNKFDVGVLYFMLVSYCCIELILSKHMLWVSYKSKLSSGWSSVVVVTVGHVSIIIWQHFKFLNVLTMKILFQRI